MLKIFILYGTVDQERVSWSWPWPPLPLSVLFHLLLSHISCHSLVTACILDPWHTATDNCFKLMRMPCESLGGVCLSTFYQHNGFMRQNNIVIISLCLNIYLSISSTHTYYTIYMLTCRHHKQHPTSQVNNEGSVNQKFKQMEKLIIIFCGRGDLMFCSFSP